MIPEIEAGTADIEITMQDVQDAMNVLCAYSYEIEENLKKDRSVFSDLVKKADIINTINEIVADWEARLASGDAFYIFGYTEKDMREYQQKIMEVKK